MKSNTFFALILVAMLAVGAGLWFTRRQDDDTTGTGTTPAPAVRNIAPEATLTYSSLYPGFTNPTSILAAALGTGGAWVERAWNDNTLRAYPDWIELTWPTSKVITGCTIVGFDSQWPPVPGTGRDSTVALRDFSVQVWVNNAWQTVVNVTGNTKDLTSHQFAAVTTTKLRVNITDTVDHDWTRIAQVQVTGRDA